MQSSFYSGAGKKNRKKDAKGERAKNIDLINVPGGENSTRPELASPTDKNEAKEKGGPRLESYCWGEKGDKKDFQTEQRRGLERRHRAGAEINRE